jgi:AraC-like DNA-binding protein
VYTLYISTPVLDLPEAYSIFDHSHDMKLYIKNMVCQRCIAAVKSAAEQSQLHVINARLGEVEVQEELTPGTRQQFAAALHQLGFELFDDRKSRIIEQIKTEVINLVHYNSEEKLKVNLSDHLAEVTGREYNYLSSLFSEVEGVTIEKFVILQRIERVKELLVYDELTLSEIAYKLGYSSVAHLSAQFKKVTDLTPSHYKQIRDFKRKPLDDVK